MDFFRFFQIMRIGLFGGTFDPVHYGHLALAREAIFRLSLDQLIWIPAIPWQKCDKKITPGHIRCNFIKAAIANEPRMSVDTIEIDAKTSSYSINTIKTLSLLYPNDQLFYLMGSDQWINFHTWKNWQEILKSCTVAVFSRNSQLEQTSAQVQEFVNDHLGCVELVNMPDVPISSSVVREIIQREGLNSKRLPKLIPLSVLNQLKSNKLVD